MPARNFYLWQTRDSLWSLAGRVLAVSGYSNTITLAEAIRAANPQIADWTNVAVGTVVYLPSVSYS